MNNILEQINSLTPKTLELTLSNGKTYNVSSLNWGFFKRLSRLKPMPHPWNSEITLSVTDAFFMILRFIENDKSLSAFQTIFMPFIGFIEGVLLSYIKGLKEDELEDFTISDVCNLFSSMYEVNKDFFSLFSKVNEEENKEVTEVEETLLEVQ